MDLHRTDEERLESLKRWWSEHGRSLIVGVVAGVAGISGWAFWQDHERRQAEAASVLFDAAGAAARTGDHAALRDAGTALLSDHAGHEYAAAAALLLAKSELVQGGLGEAKAHFRWVMEHAEQPELRGVARLRLAETAFSEGAFDEALALLGETGAGPFSAANDELRGDVHYALGERDKAREAWERAAAGYSDAPASRRWLMLKLNDLGNLNTPMKP